jgi:formylglycine-generating enzyme required for sulfatase activity
MKIKVMIFFLLGMLFSVYATNALEILSFDFDSTGTTVSWNGTLGKTYAVMTTDNLMSNFWQTAVNGTNTNCQSIVTAVEDGELQYIEQGEVSAITNRFYKIVADNTSSGMVSIPGGTNSGTDDFGIYTLTVDSFYMDRVEVTNDEMVRVMQWAYNNGKLIVSSSSVTNSLGNQQELLDLDASDCRITWSDGIFGIKSSKGNDYPCVKVTWYGSVSYCNYRSEMDGRTPCYNLNDWNCNAGANGYRLPTNDEWEYAARGGLRSKRFPWGDTITHNQANYYSSSVYSYDISSTRGFNPDYDVGEYPYTSPVGSFNPNGYGLYDMAGNVWEWCNTALDTYRGIRGGCWIYAHADFLRCSGDSWHSPGNVYPYIGFRSICR